MSIYLKSAILAAAVALGANAAGAAVISGKVEHVYPRYHRIELRNHLFSMNSRTYHSAPLHRGETLRVTYHWAHGHRWATGLKMAA
jgi:hypothetical protein